MSPSGFYAWRTRPESTRAQEDRRLKVLVHTSFTGGRGYYGSPRIYDDFVEWQEPVSRKRIIRLMQEDGLKARVRKRYPQKAGARQASTHRHTVGEHRLNAKPVQYPTGITVAFLLLHFWLC